MKKVIITMTMLLALGMGVQAASQKHRHTPQAPTELVDSANKDAVEVYSDTTGTDTAVTHTRSHKGTVTINTPWHSHTYDVDDDDIGRWLNSIDHKDIMGMFFVLCIILIIFVLAPVLIIIALFYFINKNRKQKMKLAQMAMQQGQPIPEQLLEEKPGNVDDEYQKGMRQCFVGVGLMVFLGYAAGNVGFGIGALVFCIGLGKVFASRSARKNNNREIMRDDQI
jgi:uncharacterized membrane protein